MNGTWAYAGWETRRAARPFEVLTPVERDLRRGLGVHMHVELGDRGDIARHRHGPAHHDDPGGPVMSDGPWARTRRPRADPRRIELEITETMIMRNVEQSIETLSRLRDGRPRPSVILLDAESGESLGGPAGFAERGAYSRYTIACRVIQSVTLDHSSASSYPHQEGDGSAEV